MLAGFVVVRGILIDDHGEYWSENAPILRTSFAPSHSNEGLTAYLIRNLGFVAIDLFGASCQIRFRPSLLTERAVNTIEKWLSANTYQRVALNAFDEKWNLELCGSGQSAIGRIRQIVDQIQDRRVTEFLVAPRSIDALDRYPTFGNVVENWELLARQLSERKLARMVGEMTGGRFIIVAPEPDSGRMILKGAGFGYKTLDRKWALRSRGEPLDEQPDPQYGRWLEASYSEILKRGEPALQDVDAIVSTPHFGRYRLRYTRIVLPCRSTSGDWLLSSSLLDDRVDLRVTEPRNKTAQVV